MSAYRSPRKGLVVGVLVGSVLLSACGSTTNEHAKPGPTTPAVLAVIDIARMDGVSLDVSSMPTGAPPQAPWIDGRTLHNGTHDAALPPWPKHTQALTFPFGAGSIRYDDIYGGRKTRVNLMDEAGNVTYSAPSTLPIVDDARAHVAWWEYQTRQVVLADLEAGSLTRRTLPPSLAGLLTPHGLGATIVGWLGPDDVLIRVEGEEEKADRYWRTSGRPAPIWPTRLAEGISAEARLALTPYYPYTAPREADANCLLAVDSETSQQRWRRCYTLGDQAYPARLPVFSPDGRYAVAGSISITSGEPGYTLVLDTATGAAVARFDLGSYEGDDLGFGRAMSGIVFEDNRHFLTVVTNALYNAGGERTGYDRTAIVRCDVQGRCELATPVASHNTREQAWPGPYLLE